MKRVFADTFYFVALWNPSDKARARALGYTASFQGVIVTTDWVLTELGDAMSDPANRLEFVSTFKDLEANPQVRIVAADGALFREGIQLFAARPDKKWSLTDCISFVVMTRDGIQ